MSDTVRATGNLALVITLVGLSLRVVAIENQLEHIATALEAKP